MCERIPALRSDVQAHTHTRARALERQRNGGRERRDTGKNWRDVERLMIRVERTERGENALQREKERRCTKEIEKEKERGKTR